MTVYGAVGKEVGMAYEEELEACACERHIEFSVYFYVHLRRAGGEELQLVASGDGSGEDDVVALAALETFHGIDGEVVGLWNVCHLQGSPDGSYLAAEGYNDTNTLGRFHSRLGQLRM